MEEVETLDMFEERFNAMLEGKTFVDRLVLNTLKPLI